MGTELFRPSLEGVVNACKRSSPKCRLPVNLIQAFLEVSGQTSPKETTDAQEQIYRESDRYDVEAS